MRLPFLALLALLCAACPDDEPDPGNPARLWLFTPVVETQVALIDYEPGDF